MVTLTSVGGTSSNGGHCTQKDTVMSPSWFVIRKSKELGPFTADELKHMTSVGRVMPSDLVRREGMPQPKPASTIRDLCPPSQLDVQDIASVTSSGRRGSSPNSTTSHQPPLWEKPFIVLSAIVFCFPIGLVLVWRQPTWKRFDKWKWSVIGSVIFMVVIAPKTKHSGTEVNPNREPHVNRQVGGALEPDHNVELPDNGDKNTVTTRFLPSIPGNVKHYREEVYAFDTGRKTGESEITETYGTNGNFTVERTIRTHGLQQDAHDSLQGQRRVKNGYAEIAYVNSDNKRQREFRLLHGAKQGDQWQDSNQKGKFVFVRLQNIEAHGPNGPIEIVQAVIEHQWIGINGGGELVELITEYVLARGDGIQSETAYMVLGGQKRVIRRMELTSSTQQLADKTPTPRFNLPPPPVEQKVNLPQKSAPANPVTRVGKFVDGAEDKSHTRAEGDRRRETATSNPDSSSNGTRSENASNATVTQTEPLPLPQDNNQHHIAQAVIQAGGSIELSVNATIVVIPKGGSLPRERFRVTKIDLCAVSKVVDSDLSKYTGFEELTDLSLMKTSITDASFPYLADLKNLSSLNVAGTSVTGSGFKYLNSLHNLQGLKCGGSPIKDGSLTHLKSLKKLSFLGLIDTKVTDAGLEHLREIGSLRNLRLTGTQVTNKGILRLTTIKGLEVLAVGRTKVTAAGVAAFKRALPTCKVDLQ